MLPLKFTCVLLNVIFIISVHSEYTPEGLVPEKFSVGIPNLHKSASLIKKSCNLSPNLVKEIANYAPVANQILETILTGSFKGRTYNDLAYFVDTFGPRLPGSESLENSINFMMKKMRDDGLENVHGENVSIPHWIRGQESATLITPRVKNIALIGLGLTVGTPDEGIFAEVLVVKSFEELKQNASKAKGKIVVFNQDYMGYAATSEYRRRGAVEAAKYGAVACLIRSITDVSIYTLHTGYQQYEDGVNKIPTASITVEDAEFLNRLQDRGNTMFIHLTMMDSTLRPTISRNVFGEIKGRTTPDELVILSGHIDSWDVGQGAMDDGGGMFIAEEALAVLNHHKLRPRRTLRVAFWTAEEFDLLGAKAYIKQHKMNMGKINAILESDSGTFKPLGLDFNGSEEAGCIVQEVMKLLAPINATAYRTVGTERSDIQEFVDQSVPGIVLITAWDRYWWYHHTEADTMSVENAEELDLCTALWTVVSYVLADLSVSLPRK